MGIRSLALTVLFLASATMANASLTQPTACSNSQPSIDSLIVQELLQSTQPKTLPEAQARMDALKGYYRSAHDPKEAFASVYSLVTATIQDWIAQGKFEYPLFIEQTSLKFYQMYRWAILTDCNQTRSTPHWAPESWQMVFEASKKQSFLPPTQNLLLSMTAHILHDLPYGVFWAANGEPLEKMRADYFKMNDLFRSILVPMIQILNQIEGLPDFKSVNEFIRDTFLPWIYYARAQSFEHAVDMQNCGGNTACVVQVSNQIQALSSTWSHRWNSFFPFIQEN